MSELLPCPFCGSHDVYSLASFIKCGNCDAEGPPDVGTSAADKWNTRAGLPRKARRCTYTDCADTAADGDLCVTHRKVADRISSRLVVICANCLGRGWFGRSRHDPKRRICTDCSGTGSRASVNGTGSQS